MPKNRRKTHKKPNGNPPAQLPRFLAVSLPKIGILGACGGSCNSCNPGHTTETPVTARTKAALAAKKASGVKLGNPRAAEAAVKAHAAHRAAADQFASNVSVRCRP